MQVLMKFACHVESFIPWPETKESSITKWLDDAGVRCGKFGKSALGKENYALARRRSTSVDGALFASLTNSKLKVMCLNGLSKPRR